MEHQHIIETDEICSLDRLQELINAGFCSSDVALGDSTTVCRARLGQVQLGGVDVLRYYGSGIQKAQRRVSHIRQDRADHYMLYVPLSAEVDMLQDGHQAKITPGTFAFVTMARPFTGAVYGAQPGDSYATLHVRIPASLLRERFPYIDDFCNHAFKIAPGASRIMTAVLNAAFQDGTLLTESQALAFGRTVVDVVANAALEGAELCGFTSTQPRRGRQAALVRIQGFIEENLSNPNLTTSHIADKCGISVRHLHSLFEDTGCSVASWVREMRLQRCRDMLRNPRMQDRSLTEVAFDWGFNDASHFSRVYKNRFGHSPSEERRWLKN